MKIHFGTSGWRAIIADQFTFANVRKVSLGIARYLKDHHWQNQGIIVGYDTRFLSKEFARVCAQSIADCKIKVWLTNRDTPTPVISCQILHKKTAGAINITASHNPAKYNGIKFSPAYAGPAPVAVTQEIERNIRRKFSLAPTAKGLIKEFDPRPAYLKRIKQLINFTAIRKARLKIGIDLLYGTGRGYLDQLLIEAGVQVAVLHNSRDPLFGGFSPVPAREQLRELSSLVKKKRLHLGLALDGDADRFGIVDSDGTFIGTNEVISVLTKHLILTRAKQKKVARTLATTHMVDALSRNAGMLVLETPVGFKYIGQELAKGDCLIGAEESGGLSIVGHVPEKDGILACLLIAELVAINKRPLRRILRDLYKEVGPFFCHRDDFRLSEKKKSDLLEKIKLLATQQSLLGQTIARIDTRDGYKFVFSDQSWLLFRFSGTEPVIRCYAEASSKRKLNCLLNLGQRLIFSGRRGRCFV